MFLSFLSPHRVLPTWTILCQESAVSVSHVHPFHPCQSRRTERVFLAAVQSFICWRAGEMQARSGKECG
jgi:hypothetical protein